MSLNAAERRATREELSANLVLAGRTPGRLQTELGLERSEVDAALAVAPDARAEIVWLVRDHLDALIRADGRRPRAWSVLTDRARASAASWFPLIDPPAAPGRSAPLAG